MTTTESFFSNSDNLIIEIENLRRELALERESKKMYVEEVAWLAEQLRELKRHRFGSKSERWVVEEQLVFNEAEVLAKSSKADEHEEQVETSTEVKAHRRGKRKPLPKELPREIIKIELPESDRMGVDGKPLKPIGFEVSERLHFEPAVLKVFEYHRIRYGADSGDTGVVAPPEPSIIPKGYVTSGLLAHIVMQKYGYGMPLYRQEDAFMRMGFKIPRCTMARWIVESAQKCQAIWNILEERLMASPYVSCDETHTQVLKEKGRKAESKSWMWVRATPSDEKKIVLFVYDPHRSGEVAKKLFTEYCGTLQVDGYGAYDVLEKQDGIDRIGCNMHGRRKFESAFKIGSKGGHDLSEQGMKFYGLLYDIERGAREMSWADRHKLRQEKSVSIWQDFKIWADQNQGKVPPKSKIGEAFRYFINEHKYLTGYLKDGRFEMDNGFIERQVASFAVGRKNWLFSITECGADASAFFYSIVVTAKINGNDPQKVLKMIFDQVPRAKTIDDFERIVDLILTRPTTH